jgi:hypothetical protein
MWMDWPDFPDPEHFYGWDRPEARDIRPLSMKRTIVSGALVLSLTIGVATIVYHRHNAEVELRHDAKAQINALYAAIAAIQSQHREQIERLIAKTEGKNANEKLYSVLRNNGLQSNTSVSQQKGAGVWDPWGNPVNIVFLGEVTSGLFSKFFNVVVPSIFS